MAGAKYDPHSPFSSAEALRRAYQQAKAEGTKDDHTDALLAVLEQFRKDD